MSFLEAFPDDILEEIRRYPGNEKCCDCTSFSTDWASVSHGTLICLECAGKHRSLGVQVSFVRSITMDTWSAKQIEMMVQGGNGQIKRFFQKLSLLNTPIQSLYTHRAAAHYREKLKEKVEKILAGTLPNERRQPRFSVSEKIPSIPKPTILLEGQDFYFDASFGEGTMGMTVTKHRNRAIVSKLLSDGAAIRHGVLVGDYVIGVMGKSMDDYDQIMQSIMESGRPVRISFLRYGKNNSPNKKSPDQQLQHSHSETDFQSTELSHSSTPSNHPIHRAQPTSIVKSPRFGFSATQFDEYHASSDSEMKSLKKVRSHNPAGSSSPTSKDYSHNGLKSAGSEPRRPSREHTYHTPKFFSHDPASISLDESSSVVPLSSFSGLFDGSKSLDNAQSPEIATSSPENGQARKSKKLPPRHLNSENKSHHIKSLLLDDDEETGEVVLHHSEEALQRIKSPEINLKDMNRIISKIDETLSDLDKLSPRYIQSNDPILDEFENSFEEKLRKIIEVGQLYKVFRPEEDRWRTAIIKRIHKDGTFKVVYRDGSVESHIPASRIAIPANRLQAKQKNEPSTPDFSTIVPADILEEIRNNTLHDQDSSSTITQTSYAEDSINQQYEQTFYRKQDGEFPSTSITPEPSSTPQPDSAEDIETWMKSNEKIDFRTLLNQQSADSNDLNIRIDGFISPQRNLRGIICVTFPQPPLGLTIAVNGRGEPEITRVKVGSVGDRHGISTGDLITHIGNYPIRTYEEAMNIIPYSSYPLTLCIKKKEFVSKSFDPTDVEGEGPTILQYLKKSRDDITLKSDKVVTKKLSLFPTDPLEFDVLIVENDVNFLLEELNGQSVVKSVMDDSSYMAQGLTPGCIIVGVNYEPYQSHSHTLSLFKTGKRPLTIRFKSLR